MTQFYHLGIGFYYWAIRLTALWNPKARKWVDGRKDLLDRIEQLLDPTESKIWIHCPSLGEFEQGRPVIEALRKEYPHRKIILTFFSPSGYEIQEDYAGADHIFYLPMDTRRNAKRMVRAVNPSLTIFVKYDFWLNYLTELKKHGSTTILISGIFRPHQHFFGRFPQIGRKMLDCFDHFFVQDEQSVQLLKNAGYHAVTKSGDTRFDRVKALVERAEPVDNAARLSNGAFTVVAGSTWPADEELLLPLINHSGYQITWIIAPHEISEGHLRQLEKQINKSVVRYSAANKTDLSQHQVMLIDNIGLLSRIYQYADIAYVGGGFGKSIHNILEAAAWGASVLFGPRHEKFAEANALMKAGGAVSINDETELKEAFNLWYRSQEVRQKASASARGYVMGNAGASKMILSWIKDQKVID